jgi:integrase
MDRKKYTLHERNGVWQLRFTATIKGKNVLIRESLKTRDYNEAIKAADERAKEIYEDYEFKLNKAKLREFTIDQAFGFYYEEHGQFCSNPRKHLTFIRNLAKYFDKELPFYMLTEEDLSTFVREKRKQGVCNATINRNLAILTAIYNLCKKRRIAVPDIDIKSFKLKDKAIRTIYIEDRETLDKIINVVEDWLKPVIKFALLTGFRVGNILKLKWSDISSDRITIVKKNCRYEDGDIQIKMIFPELQALLDSLPRCSEYVFTRDGRPISYASLLRHWTKAFKVTGIKYINPHGLRHTHATWLLQKTNNLKLVSDSLGHSSIAMTTRYAHLMKNEEANIMQKVFAN